jgi:hypothetical protein
MGANVSKLFDRCHPLVIAKDVFKQAQKIKNKELKHQYLKIYKGLRRIYALEENGELINFNDTLKEDVNYFYDSKGFKKLENILESRTEVDGQNFETIRDAIHDLCVKLDDLMFNIKHNQNMKAIYEKMTGISHRMEKFHNRTTNRMLACCSIKMTLYESTYQAAAAFAIDLEPQAQNLRMFRLKKAGDCFGLAYKYADNINNGVDSFTGKSVSVDINTAIRQNKNYFLSAKKNTRHFEPKTSDYSVALWKILDNLNKKNILILTLKNHAAVLRQIGNKGVELYDPNFGIFRFANKNDFVSFSNIHLTYYEKKKKPVTLSVYTIPKLKNNHAIQQEQLTHKITPSEREEAIESLSNRYGASWITSSLELKEIEMQAKGLRPNTTEYETPELLNNAANAIVTEVKRLTTNLNKTLPTNQLIKTGEINIETLKNGKFIQKLNYLTNNKKAEKLSKIASDFKKYYTKASTTNKRKFEAIHEFSSEMMPSLGIQRNKLYHREPTSLYNFKKHIYGKMRLYKSKIDEYSETVKPATNKQQKISSNHCGFFSSVSKSEDNGLPEFKSARKDDVSTNNSGPKTGPNKSR